MVRARKAKKETSRLSFSELKSESLNSFRLLTIDSPELWEEIITKLLNAYRFRELERSVVTHRITVLKGRFYDTMMWQSSALAEFGFGPDIDYRDDPPVDSPPWGSHHCPRHFTRRSVLSVEEETAIQDGSPLRKRQ